MRGGKTVTVSGFILLLLLLMITYASNLFMRESTASNAWTNAAISTTIDAAELDETAPEFPESTTESVHKHSYSSYFINPSCTESGYTEHTCACGDFFTDTEVEAHGHYYQLSETVEATCTDRGYTVYICDYCGDSYKWDYTTARGHDFTEEVVEATTEEQGYTLYTCKMCGHSYKDNFTSAKPVETGHVHSYSGEVIAPTCTADGYTTHTCTKCGDRYNDARTEATGHSYTSTVSDPTTDAEGYTQYTCSVCGYSYKDTYTQKLPVQTDPPHEHEYTCTSVDGTCLEEGHYLYECACGHSYKEPNGQGWAEHDFELAEYVAPTPEADGYTLEICTVCGYEFKHTIEYEEEGEEVPLDPAEVAAAVVKYINLFRAEQGSSQLTYLPGMSQVAQYRSVQLTTNFAHDTSDEREAHAYYKYGRYVDLSEYGGDPSQNYYTSDTGEAIGKTYNSNQNTADELGESLAGMFLNSSGHWDYVGSARNSYVGVGCTKSGSTWYVCVLVGPINYG